MKRRILVTVVVLLVHQVASAQLLVAFLFGDKLNSDKVEFGLLTGPTFTQISSMGSASRTAFNLGLYFNFKLSDRFALHPEVVPKSSFGATGLTPYLTGNAAIDSLFMTADVTRKINAISFPVLCRYRLGGLFFLEAGPQINLIIRVRDRFEKLVDDNELSNTINVSSQFTASDINFIGGFSAKLGRTSRSMAIGARYCYGVSDILQDVAGMQRNEGFLVTLQIPVIGAKHLNRKQ